MKIKFSIVIQALLFITLFVTFKPAAAQGNSLDIYQDPAFWKRQALSQIIPFWENTVDRTNGGFFTDIGRDGTIGPESRKYPRMISRAVFGFSVAYLLSGEDKYLEYASYGLKYLTNYGWDRKNGGWYEYVNSDSSPGESGKNLFDETYGNLGPSVYYLATHDKTALRYVEDVHRLMQAKAWDNEDGGYYAEVNNDWSVSGTEKSFNAEIDTCSAYLIYYYLATRDPSLLEDLERISDTSIKHMIGADTGFVTERWSKKWNSIDRELWVGHNLKTAWVLMRTYWLTGDDKYRDAALKIASAMIKNDWDTVNYGWFFQFRENNPGERKTVKDWWTQEEGNVLMLNLYRLTGDGGYLDYFKKCSYFWSTYIVDNKYGECYPTVQNNGAVIDGYKGNLYKSAYHTMEHALFNYLYTSLYVGKTDAELFFRLDSASDGEIHYVKLVEDPEVLIKSVEINGKPWKNYDAAGGYIKLPKGNNMKTKVVFGRAISAKAAD